MRTPPRTSGTPSAKACASTPVPTRSSLTAARPAAQSQPRRDPRQILGRRHLEELRVAFDDLHPSARRLDEGGAVGRLAAAPDGPAKKPSREALRRLHRVDGVAPDGLRDA